MNISVDAGKNITDLLEKLASQIGTTVDKVFPWLVAQARIEGYVDLISNIVLVIIMSIITYFLIKQAIKYYSIDDDIYFPSAIGAIISSLGFLFSLIVFTASVSTYVGKIFNPHFFALKSLMTMVK